MDALSHLLSLYPVVTALDTRCRSSTPWAMEHGARPQGTAPYHLIVEGNAVLHLADQTALPLMAGDMLVLPRGQAHALDIGAQAADGQVTDILCGQFRFGAAIASKLISALPDVLLIRTAGQKHFLGLQALTNLLRDEASVALPGQNAVVSHVASALFALILRAWMTQADSLSGVLSLISDARLAPALEHMLTAPEKDWTLAQLAQLCNMSRATFVRSFRKVAGTTPGELLLHIRMAQSAQWLKQAHRSVADIAAAVGYQSESLFSKAFKRHMGHGPGLYRRGAGDSTAPWC